MRDRKIVDYHIVEGRPKQVESEVQQLLAMDWEVNGNLFVTAIDRNIIAIQCLVKYEEG